jgi:hypothetical protein
VTLPKKATKPERPRWKLSPSEVPPELSDNFVVRYLADLTPEQEAAIERAEALDAAIGDGRPDDE